MSETNNIKNVQAFNGDGIQVYPLNAINSVIGLEEEIEKINSSISNILEKINTTEDTPGYITEQLNSLQEEIKKLTQKDTSIDASINKNIEDIGELYDLSSSLQDYCEYLDKEKENSFEWYNIHLKKSHKTSKNKIIVTIENFDNKLRISNGIYRIALMKQSKKKKCGNEWRVPLFNKNSKYNRYYFDVNNQRLETPKGDYPITSQNTEVLSISELPCVDIKTKKNSRQYKYYPIYYREGEVEYVRDTTYIFKNSSSKKLHLGYAIFKYDGVKKRWIRVSNIAKVDLYAYEISKDGSGKENKKFFINII